MKTQIHSQKVFTFRQWSRKSYAVFQSLKLQVRIATLSIGLMLIPGFQELVAQEKIHHEALEEYDLDTMEVLGELTPELAKNLSRNIQVISIPARSSLPLSSLQSTLNSVSQLDIRQRGPNDVQADISLRASTFDQVQILLNGFDMTDPQTGHHSLNLPIAFSQLQQLQILSGSGTRALGVNSYAGSINFVTKRTKDNLLELETNVGSFGFNDMNIFLGINKNRMSNYVFVNRTSSKGYTNNTDFVKYSMFYNGQFYFKKSNLEWQLAYMDKAFGANDFYTPKYPNQFEELHTAIAGIRFNTIGKISSSTSVSYRANADRFELFRDGFEAPSWYAGHNYHLTQVLQLNAKTWSWWKYGKTSMSMNYRLESIFSNVLGLQMNKQIPAVFDRQGFYDKSDSRNYFNVSLEHIYLWNDFKIAGGFMYYEYLSDDSPRKIYPGVDITYNVSKNIKLYVGINTGMRLPTFTDLYYSGPSNIGNPDLLPESQISYQIGIKNGKNALQFSANAFVNNASNSIDWVRKSDTLKWQPINITNVETRGVDFSFSFVPAKLKVDRMKWLNQAMVNFSFNDKSTSTPDYQSHYVMDYLRYKFVISLNHKVVGGFSLGYILRYQERLGRYLEYDFDNNTSNSVYYEPFTLFDVKLNWEYSSWKLYASVSNVFDVRYQDYGNVIQAGRWFKIGVKKTFLMRP